MQSTEEYNHQENEQESGGFISAGFKMLNLNTTTTSTLIPTTNTTVPPPPPSYATATRCTNRGNFSSSTTKRRSPYSSFSLQPPSAKKQLLALLNPPTDIQISPPPSHAPILRRCISDPVNSPRTTQFSNPQSPPENAKTIDSCTTPSPAKGTSSLPPLPRDFRRSISDPLSHSPSSGELGNSGSRNRGGENPNSKCLKRLMEGTKEIIQLWEQVLGEEGEEKNTKGCGNCNDNGGITEVECAAGDETEEGETKEAVSVEKRGGECLVLHFKCPCQKGYQILLSGNNCYYKLE